MTTETLTRTTAYVWTHLRTGATLDDGLPMTTDGAEAFIRDNWSEMYEVTVGDENLILVRHKRIGGEATEWIGTPVNADIDPHDAISSLETALCGAIPDDKRGQLSDVLRAIVDGVDPAEAAFRLLGVPAPRVGA